MTKKRNRYKQTVSFDERLREAARAARDTASELPQGSDRESLMRKARQVETALRISAWLATPGTQFPT